jgi:diketogulonate reductase-like aldo/keto reductase
MPCNEFAFYGMYLLVANTCILIIGSNMIATALRQGYLLIDTAEFYNNEHSVGLAIKQSNKKREEVFVISKWWPTSEGAKGAIKSLDQCLKKLVVGNFSLIPLFLLIVSIQAMLIST